MGKSAFKTLAIIGTGMVGTALAVVLKKVGYSVTAISDPKPAARKRALAYLGPVPHRRVSDIATDAECFFITTPDGLIEAVCRKLSSNPAIAGRHVFHVSGAGGLNLLNAAKNAGARVGCIHPLQSFSSIDGAIDNLPGSYFGITASGHAGKLAARIVSDLQGIPLQIRPDQKPLYHAAACIASNYFVCLMSAVEALCRTCGIPARDARKAFLPLVSGSMRNIKRYGATQALTGPIARGDLETLQSHLQALAESAPKYLPMYQTLGDLTAQLAVQKKTISRSRAKTISELFKGD